MSAFGISRADGRSNPQVILDFVRRAEPGTIFTFEQLQEELAKGTDREYDRAAVCGVVNQANPRLLKEHQRRLYSVRGQGYRLSHGNDHLALATSDQRRAAKQQARSLLTLQNAPWDEMDPTVRDVTQATLVLVGGVVASQDAMSRRMDKIEDAIRNMKGTA